MVGTLELHAYAISAGGEFVRDTRLVIVDTPRQVDVSVSADRACKCCGNDGCYGSRRHFSGS